MTPRERFLKLLRDDILQVELAELDFGIYRLLNHRRAELDKFLAEQLPAQIDAALATLPGAAGEDEQARIYNELYTFFKRYYEDGDFVARARRGRDAAYSVPYNGEDTYFHWATRGSHYVKSGERFAGYAYRQPDGRRIALSVRAADTEKDNAKGERRYYVPAACEADADGARLLFDYRKLDAKEARRYERKAAGSTGDPVGDAEDVAAPAAEGRSAQERLLNAWRDGTDFKSVAVPAGIDQAALARHAQRYVKGQTFENRKFVLEANWLVRASALAKLPGGEALVAQAAANQKQVAEWARWVGEPPKPPRDASPSPESAGEAEISLPCEAGEGRGGGKSAAQREDGPALLQRYPHLPIHTAHFDADFKAAALACFDDLDAATGGLLIHAENYAALRTIEPAYRQGVKCIYIDPPYNAGPSEILYKNDLRHSSWLALLRITGSSRNRVGDFGHFPTSFCGCLSGECA